MPISAVIKGDEFHVGISAFSSVIGYNVCDNLTGTLELTEGGGEKLSTRLVYHKKSLRVIGEAQVSESVIADLNLMLLL